MSARAAMTMRATISRDTESTDNDWGTPATPSFTEVGVIPCRAWSVRKEDKSDSSKGAFIEQILAMVPKGADVEERDQVTNIRDRSGEVQFAGPLYVATKMRGGSSGSRASHFTLSLMRNM
jgi:hypothetical protein